MDFNFSEAITALGANAAFRVANVARPATDYLFNTLLPERNEPGYTAKSGNMTIRATMAGLTGKDSPYPPSGIVEMSTFMQEVAKIANQAIITEEALRRIQDLLMQMTVNSQPTNEFLQNEVLNFLNKVVLQAHLDRMEWLRGQALVTGAINWTFNQLILSVSYGVPAANLLTNRTGTDAWDSTASKFWADVRLLTSALRYNVRAFIIHPDTLYAVLNNDANKAEILRQDATGITLRRLIGDNERPSQDARDSVTLIPYGLEGEIPDLVTPGQTVNVPFMPTKKLLAVANNNRAGYRVGEGSTDDPVADLALGYTHLAPTTEGGGKPGRWAQVYTPENLPMQLHGRGVTNGLPVIEAPTKIAVASSDIT